MKKLICLFMCLVLLSGLIGCGQSKNVEYNGITLKFETTDIILKNNTAKAIFKAIKIEVEKSVGANILDENGLTYTIINNSKYDLTDIHIQTTLVNKNGIAIITPKGDSSESIIINKLDSGYKSGYRIPFNNYKNLIKTIILKIDSFKYTKI